MIKKVIMICSSDNIYRIMNAVDWAYLQMYLEAAVSDYSQGKNLILRSKPDLVIMDSALDGKAGLDFIEELKVSGYKGKIIIAADSVNDLDISRCLHFGVTDIIPGDSDKKKISAAVVYAAYHDEVTGRKLTEEEFQRRESEISDTERLIEKNLSYYEEEKKDFLPSLFSGELEPDKANNYVVGQLSLSIRRREMINSDWYRKMTVRIGATVTGELEQFTDRVYWKCGRGIIWFICEFKKTLPEHYGQIDRCLASLSAVINSAMDLSSILVAVGKAESSDYHAFEDVWTTIGLLLDDKYRQKFSGDYMNITSMIREMKDLPYAVEFDKDHIYQLMAQRDIEHMLYDIEKECTNKQYPSMILTNTYQNLLKEVRDQLIRDGVDRKAIKDFNGYNLLELFASSSSVIGIKLAMRDYLRALFEAVDKSSGARGSAALEAVKDYIDKHYKDNLTLDELAGVAYLTRTYLSTAFKKEYGITIRDYIKDQKLTFARDLLSEPAVSVASAAAQSGYKDVKYFSRLFKKKFGIYPSEIRKNYV